MNLSNEDFYREASGCLLGSTSIFKAWQDCLMYMRTVIPAEFFSLHLFSPGLDVVETVVDATPERSESVSCKTTLIPEARKAFQARLDSMMSTPKILIIDDLSKFPGARQLGMDLGTPDSPCLALYLFREDRFLGIAALTGPPGIRYSEAQGQLFFSIHAPLAATAEAFYRCRELERVRELLTDKAAFLSQELLNVMENEIVGAESGLKQVMTWVGQVALTDTPVLLQGETGTGKEIIAGAIHRASARKSGPFIKVNCGAITPTLLESELFGHEKGAFTGASQSRPGYFERADGGTIFLDEVAELSAEAQVRLLRVLQDKEVERVGGKYPLKLSIRVLAATHKDLAAMVREGTFRQDLFFRLNVFPITIPALRDRIGDIPALAHHLLTKKAREMALPDIPEVAPGAVNILMAYDWPGNVRELENIIERQIIVNRGKPITFDMDATEFPARKKEGAELTLDSVIARHITAVLHMADGRIEGKDGAAEYLGLNPRTLRSRMEKLGIPFGRNAASLYK